MSDSILISDFTVDRPTPLNEHLSGKYRQSFAFATLDHRMSAILNQALQQLVNNTESIVQEHGSEARLELRMIKDFFNKVDLMLKDIIKLGRDITSNKPFVPLNSNGADVKQWNEFLREQAKKENGEIRWYATVWLYAECYMYRRLREVFELCRSLRGYDPFRQMKETALINAMPAMMVLADYLVNELEEHEKNPKALEETCVREELTRLVHISVWGNKCDLSISCGADIDSVDNPLRLVEQYRDAILVDETDNIWTVLSGAKKGAVAVHIVADNAGYEIFTDLCLADFLCTFSLADTICFHLKSMPWFVSDAMPYDMDWAIRTLAASQQPSPSLAVLSNRWQSYLHAGKWSTKAEDFWTLPYDYHVMKTIDPSLYESLSQATLIIFKGDLNYRKLLGEINYRHTSNFMEALCCFRPSRIVALRTVKADIICGLEPGQSEAAKEKNPDWMITGDYAVIQFAEKAS